ncbi:MFS transporter [Ferribacterium limneticum]|uniref:MFS transporter n=1 Tax=Ferribacterium limneticum TaxID=76259 RepID=UPI001CF9A8A6|nr:MFS transporter [Ferribacterium limneticum]UCV17785.1 MFS transporter [Ferribacterium limneticum]
MSKTVPTPPNSQLHSSLNIRVIGLATFASMATTRICDSMLVALAQDFGVTTGAAAGVVSWYSIAYGVIGLLYGPFGDRIGKLRVVAAACLACGFFALSAAVSPNLTSLLWARVAMGTFSAAIIPLSMAWIGDSVSFEHRQETLAKLTSWTVSGMMFGVWFGGIAADYLSWRAAFLTLAVALLWAGWSIHRWTPPNQAATHHYSGAPYFQSLLKLWERRTLWILFLSLFEGITVMGAVAFIPSRLIQHFGLSATMAGGVMLLFGMGGIAYSRMARYWLRLIGAHGLALLGGVLIALGLFGLAVADHPAIGIASSTIAGIGFYMIHGNLQTQASQMAPTARGTALSFFSCMVFLGQSLGVMIMAICLDNGLVGNAFVITAGLVLLLGWLVSSVSKAN